MPSFRIAVLALPILLAACAFPAQAQDATVAIGPYTKKTSGKVTALEAGDLACYLTLRDETGKEFKEMADFDICTQNPSIMGKRARLTYALRPVMSEECQGDPDCKKTRYVALVVAARIIDAAR